LKKYRGMVRSSWAESVENGSRLVSQVLYLVFAARAGVTSARGPARKALNPLIPHYCGAKSEQSSKTFRAATKSTLGFKEKDFTGELFFARYFSVQGGVRPVYKGESQNGLESTKDRRSAGGHGNQHVRLRRPQISGDGRLTFIAGGPPGVTRSRSWSRVRLVSTSKRFDL
jgi:hypothetical protein